MAAPAVTYTFANSTTADASQVNQNFTDIINGVSDGTKDLSISALTVAGTATLNGNVALGNASGDDITMTGSLASSIPVKTTNSFNVGDSTHGLASIYFGANSQTVRLLPSGSMSATWTMTLPVTAGTDKYILRTNGSGVTSWAQIDTPLMFTSGAAATAGGYGVVTYYEETITLTNSGSQNMNGTVYITAVGNLVNIDVGVITHDSSAAPASAAIVTAAYRPAVAVSGVFRVDTSTVFTCTINTSGTIAFGYRNVNTGAGTSGAGAQTTSAARCSVSFRKA